MTSDIMRWIDQSLSAGISQEAAKEALKSSPLLLSSPGTPISFIGYYRQYSRFTHMPNLKLMIKNGQAGQVEGSGRDEVGKYQLSGFITKSGLELQKNYISGTGNSRENYGHAVHISMRACLLPVVLENRQKTSISGFFGYYRVPRNSTSGIWYNYILYSSFKTPH